MLSRSLVVSCNLLLKLFSSEEFWLIFFISTFCCILFSCSVFDFSDSSEMLNSGRYESISVPCNFFGALIIISGVINLQFFSNVILPVFSIISFISPWSLHKIVTICLVGDEYTQVCELLKSIHNVWVKDTRSVQKVSRILNFRGLRIFDF